MNTLTFNPEPESANIINNYSQKEKKINIVGKITDVSETTHDIKSQNVEVVFLDNYVPNIDSLDFLKNLPEQPHFVLVNSASKQVINCFSVNTRKNQLVPISTAFFFDSINNTSLENTEKILPQYDKQVAKFLFIKVGSSTVKVSYDDIQYIEGLKDYVKIHVGTKKPLITKCTIKYIENKLPNGIFSRIHKSYIVSIEKIDKIEFNHTFIGGNQLPIGMQFKESFYNLIDQYRL